MDTSAIKNTLATYLNPYYHPKEKLSGMAYGLSSLTHMTEKASTIKNSALRHIAQFFALAFDAVIGFGIVSTLASNTAALLFNNTYARVRNFVIAKKAIETNKQWNKTALKTWGVIAGVASVGLLYHFGALSALKNLFTKTPASIPNTAPQETANDTGMCMKAFLPLEKKQCPAPSTNIISYLSPLVSRLTQPYPEDSFFAPMYNPLTHLAIANIAFYTLYKQIKTMIELVPAGKTTSIQPAASTSKLPHSLPTVKNASPQGATNEDDGITFSI
jgi:hypothetical protein